MMPERVARLYGQARRQRERYGHWVSRHQRMVYGAVAAYIGLTVAALLALNVSLSPDRVILLLLPPAIILGKGARFVRDWSPFLAVIIVYESLRGFADNIQPANIHVADLIAFERWLFGAVPTIWLQERLFSPGMVSWYDLGLTIQYFCHFPLPLVLAFWLWVTRYRVYWQFVLAFGVLCMAGFVTYVLFPAAPPWYAAREGVLPPVAKIINHTLGVFPGSVSISTLYTTLNPNPVAAMPSLHAAFPTLVLLFLAKTVRWRALWFLPYCLALWFGIVYLGEHYVIDALAGILYAAGAFGVAAWLTGRTRRRLPLTPPGGAAPRPGSAGLPALTADAGA